MTTKQGTNTDHSQDIPAVATSVSTGRAAKETAVLRNRWRQPPSDKWNAIDPAQLNAHVLWLEGDTIGGKQLDLGKVDDLIGADLPHADLRRAIISADLRHAKLSGANLQGADLREAILWDADLTDADLTDATGLVPRKDRHSIHPLSGADLCGATVPGADKAFPALHNSAEISKNAGKAFGALIGATAALQLTVFTATDAQLALNQGNTQIIGTSVTVSYLVLFGWGPVILLFLYIQFHLYLQRLWENLASLPAVFPDGLMITQKVYPWMLTDVVACGFPALKSRRQPLSGVKSLLFRVAAYWLVPASMFGFWIRYLLAHDLNVSMWHVAIATVFALTASLLYPLARATLRRDESVLRQWNDPNPLRPASIIFASLIRALGVLVVFGTLTMFVLVWAPAEGSNIATSGTQIGAVKRWIVTHFGPGGASNLMGAFAICR